MRVIVFFDLPVKTRKDRKEYAHFRKFLIKDGFVMMQESVYTKLAINQNAVSEIIKDVKRHKPPSGIVQALSVTERQFEKMEFITGSSTSDVVSTDERLLIL